MHRNLDFIRLMFYRDHHMNRLNLQSLKTNNTGDTDWRKRFDDDGFHMDFFSSNNPEYLKTRPGYFICRSETNINFVQTVVSKFSYRSLL